MFLLQAPVVTACEFWAIKQSSASSLYIKNISLSVKQKNQCIYGEHMVRGACEERFAVDSMLIWLMAGDCKFESLLQRSNSIFKTFISFGEGKTSAAHVNTIQRNKST